MGIDALENAISDFRFRGGHPLPPSQAARPLAHFTTAKLKPFNIRRVTPSMPRYHFHTEDGHHHHPDPDGLDLAGARAVRTEAIRAIGQLVSERHDEFWRDGSFRMIVADDTGLTLIILDLTATISPAMHHDR
jgi:hypothetical protein